MGPIGREAVGCSTGCNWCALILLLFAAISASWTWGYGIAPPSLTQNRAVLPFYVSTGPWVAGLAWSSFWVPCSCANGFCNGVCVVGTTPVMWGSITPEAACDPESLVYLTWSGPLGYCNFPSDYVIPTPPPTWSPTVPFPPGVTGQDSYGNVPNGTTFSGPSQVVSVQALSIIAVIACFFAALLGCADIGSTQRNKGIAAGSILCTLITWVFSLAALSLWTAIPYVMDLQNYGVPRVNVPIWVNQSDNYLSVIQVYDMWMGPAWATILTAFIMVFFANLVQCAAFSDGSSNDDGYIPASPMKDAAPTTGPIPAVAVPVAAGAAQPAAPAQPASVGKDIASV